MLWGLKEIIWISFWLPFPAIIPLYNTTYTAIILTTGSPILNCLAQRNSGAKQLLLHPTGTAAARGSTSGEEDVHTLPPGNDARLPTGLFKSVLAILCRLEDLYVGPHDHWSHPLFHPPQALLPTPKKLMPMAVLLPTIGSSWCWCSAGDKAGTLWHSVPVLVVRAYHWTWPPLSLITGRHWSSIPPPTQSPLLPPCLVT